MQTAHISNAYGFNDWQPGGTSPGSISFGGQFGYNGDVNGLLLLTHRFYDQNTGRFLTRDPMGYDGGINLYAYTGNNPVNGSDPSGYGYHEAGNLQDIGEPGGGPPKEEAPVGPSAVGGVGGASEGGGGGGTVEAEPPGFVVTPGGTAVSVPAGANGPFPTTGSSGGFQYQGGFGGGVGQFPDGNGGGLEMNSRVTGVRLMNPTPRYPDGYACYMNISGQTVNPGTGMTVSNSSSFSHWPLTPLATGY